MFQWALLCELGLTIVVWGNNLIVDTDLAHMSAEQIEHKLYFDIVVDRENTNHWLPALLLLIEWHINCIPISWKHIPFFLTLSTFYTCVNATYCLYYKVIIYPGVDWNNNFFNALAKGQASVAIEFFCFLIMWSLNIVKFRLKKINV